jgi:hypothetical protein
MRAPRPAAGLLAAALSGDLVGLQRGLQRDNSLALSALEANTYRLSSAQVRAAGGHAGGGCARAGASCPRLLPLCARCCTGLLPLHRAPRPAPSCPPPAQEGERNWNAALKSVSEQMAPGKLTNYAYYAVTQL